MNNLYSNAMGRCAERVYPKGSLYGCQCSRRATVVEAIDGKRYGFCRQHAPTAREERRRDRIRRQDAEAARRDRRSRKMALAREAYEALRDNWSAKDRNELARRIKAHEDEGE